MNEGPEEELFLEVSLINQHVEQDIIVMMMVGWVEIRVTVEQQMSADIQAPSLDVSKFILEIIC